MTDPQLLEQFVTTREHEPFRELVHRHQAMVMGVCARRLRNPADRDDAFQETFIKLARRAAKIDQSVGAWLYQTANTTAIDILRRRQARDRHERQGGVAQQALSTDQANDTKPTLREQALLDDAIQSLATDDQRVIVGYFFEQRTQRQLAEQLGINQSTVKRRIDSALETMRSKLARQGVAITAVTLGTTLTTAKAWAQTPSTELVAAVISQASQTAPLPATLSGALKMWIISHKVTSAAAAVVVSTSIGIGVTQATKSSNAGQQAQAVQAPQQVDDVAAAADAEELGRIFKPTANDTEGSSKSSASGPNGYIRLSNYTLPQIIAVAYDLPSKHLVIAETELPLGGYDVDLKGPDWKQVMIQALRDEFGLVIEKDRRPIDSYTLSLPEDGAHRLKRAGRNELMNLVSSGKRGVVFTRIPIQGMVDNFELWLNARVLDQTGLDGDYNLTLPWYGGMATEQWIEALRERSGLVITYGPVEQDVAVVQRANKQAQARLPLRYEVIASPEGVIPSGEIVVTQEGIRVAASIHRQTNDERGERMSHVGHGLLSLAEGKEAFAFQEIKPARDEQDQGFGSIYGTQPTADDFIATLVSSGINDDQSFVWLAQSDERHRMQVLQDMDKIYIYKTTPQGIILGTLRAEKRNGFPSIAAVWDTQGRLATITQDGMDYVFPLDAQDEYVVGYMHRSADAGAKRETDRPFIWTKQGGLVAIPLPDGRQGARAVAVDDSGRVLLAADNRPYLWSKNQGHIPLTIPKGYTSAQPIDMNNTGLILLNCYSPELGRRLCITTADGRAPLFITPLHDGAIDYASSINENGMIAIRSIRYKDKNKPGISSNIDAIDGAVLKPIYEEDAERNGLDGLWIGNEQGQQRELTLSIEGRKLKYDAGEGREWYEAEIIKMDPNADPPTMDLRITDSNIQPLIGLKALAIYERKGQALTLAGQQPGLEGRPAEFIARGTVRVMELTRGAE